MPAKPILDLMTAVDRLPADGWLPDDDRRRQIAESLGYEHRGAAGVKGRVVFAKGPEACRAHLFAIAIEGSDYWRDKLRFRNYLRAHPPIAKEYAELKIRLAAIYTEARNDHTDAKSAFVDRVLALARRDEALS